MSELIETVTPEAPEMRTPSGKIFVLTPLEKEMISRGFYSTRLVAMKLRRTQQTVLRSIRIGKLKCTKLHTQNFIAKFDLVEYLGGEEAAQVLNLDDWSDILP